MGAADQPLFWQIVAFQAPCRAWFPGLGRGWWRPPSRRPGDHRRLPQGLLKTSSGALNTGRAVLPDMRDSYETPADHRPWQARHTDWAAPGPRQDHPGHPAAAPADAQARPPRWSGLGLSQDPVPPPEPASGGPGPAGSLAPDPDPRRFPGDSFPGDSGPAGLGPADRGAQDPYPNQSGRAAHAGSLEYRPANWVGHDPYRRNPIVPPQPSYPAHTVPFWRQGWADCDPYTGYPMWPGHADDQRREPPGNARQYPPSP